MLIFCVATDLVYEGEAKDLVYQGAVSSTGSDSGSSIISITTRIIIIIIIQIITAPIEA